jgi:hypothetical protein
MVRDARIDGRGPRHRVRRGLAILIALCVSGVGTGRAAEVSAPPIAVTFVRPDRFTDVRDGLLASAKGSAAILDDIAAYLRTLGQRYVPAGSSLDFRITDLDLAGEFEPQLGPNFERVRIFKDVYWPRIDFEFRLADGTGHTIREGRRSVSDQNYLQRAVFRTGDPLRYEKDMLREWFKKEFSAASTERRP